MSSLTQDDDRQISYVLLSIWYSDKFDKMVAMGNKERWCYGLCGNEHNIWNSTRALMRLTRSGDHSIVRCRV